QGPQPHAFPHDVVLARPGEAHHARRQLGLPPLPQHPDAVPLGHADVEDEDVRLVLVGGPEGFLAVRAARDHAEVAVGLEEPLEPVEDDGVIVGDDQADGHGQARTRASGRRIASREPVSEEATTSAPPWAATRSRRLTGPMPLAWSVARSWRPWKAKPRPSSVTSIATSPAAASTVAWTMEA